MDLGSLKRALIVLKFSSPNYVNKLDLCYEYGSGENLAFQNLLELQNLEINRDCFARHCDIKFQTYENHSNITLVLTYVQLLMDNRNGFVYLMGVQLNLDLPKEII